MEIPLHLGLSVWMSKQCPCKKLQQQTYQCIPSWETQFCVSLTKPSFRQASTTKLLNQWSSPCFLHTIRWGGNSIGSFLRWSCCPLLHSVQTVTAQLVDFFIVAGTTHSWVSFTAASLLYTKQQFSALLASSGTLDSSIWPISSSNSSLRGSCDRGPQHPRTCSVAIGYKSLPYRLRGHPSHS